MNKYKNIFITTTDTVLGIGCHNENDIKLIFELKQRPENKKIIILFGSIDQARKHSLWNDNVLELAKKVWPGNTTLIINNQGFRVPKNPKLQNYLIKNGYAYVTSCNKSGKSPILDIENAQKIFPEIKNVYNFGIGNNKPSNIIDTDNNNKKVR